VIKLFVCDIDFTLLDAYSGGLPSRNIDAMIRLQASGVKVVLASGRVESGILPIVKQLRMDEFGGYVASSNGTRIIETLRFTPLLENLIPVEDLLEMYHHAIKLGLHFSVEQGDTVYTNGFDDELAYDRDVVKLNFNVCDDLSEHLKQGAPKCAVTVDRGQKREEIKEFCDTFKDRFEIVNSMGGFIDIMRKGSSKGHAIEFLCSHLNITLDEVAAIGDSTNDLEMLALAGISACVANAREEVKAIAKHHVASAQEGGVAEFIDIVLSLNKRPVM